MEMANTAPAPERAAKGAVGSTVVIGLVGFLTLVDLFAAQAILPTLARRFDATPAEIGLAANAGTLGMAIAGLGVALVGGGVNRRAGVVAALALLAVPTALLASAETLTQFSVLRVLQGLAMASAFSLTMAYLGERCTASQSATALAAYVTGAVASNLIGRLVAATLVETAGLAVNFYVFAALNLAGAALVLFTFRNVAPMTGGAGGALSPLRAMARHLGNRCLLASFAIGFLILFAFIGVFTYVNFVLAGEPIALSPMALGLVYFVFLPSMATTPFAGRIAARFGARLSFFVCLGVSALALPLMLAEQLPVIMAGLTLFAAGTFFAQATATGFVGRAAKADRAAASGLYLASYYFGGLAGAAALGRLYDASGWPATLGAVAAALGLAAALAAILKETTAEPAKA